MKKITYFCNLCSDETPKTELMALYFSDLKKFQLTTKIDSSDRHICKKCHQIIKDQTEIL